VISAYGNISLIRSAMRAGSHDFLIKPTDFNDLANTLQKASTTVRERKKSEETYRRLSAITDELDVSARLQKSILPGNVLKKDGIEIYAQTDPAAEVGGDFYDFFWINDHQLGIVMADVSGKNVSAALFMTMSRTLIKSLASFSTSPADCFAKVNAELLKENVATMFVTAIYGIVDTKEKTLTYTNAGHLPIALFNAKRPVEFLKCDSGMALGIDDSVVFENNVQVLTPGDVILLYTDGVSEANNLSGDEYDFARLEKCLNENRTLSPKPLTEELLKSIRAFTEGASQSDDITTLCLKYREKVVYV
jgi:sigma-B regulation protein RsbU (phosphoserine phosphatase)